MITSWTDMPVMALVSPSSCIISCCPLRGIGADREIILVQKNILQYMTTIMTMMTVIIVMTMIVTIYDN